MNLQFEFEAVTEQVTQTKYPSVTLDTEIKFSKGVEEVSNRDIKTWHFEETMRINMVLYTPTKYLHLAHQTDFGAVFWALASTKAKEKIDKIEYRTSKIIIDNIAYGPNYMVAEEERHLSPFGKRTNLPTVKFTEEFCCRAYLKHDYPILD